MTVEGRGPERLRAVARSALTLTGGAVAIQILGASRELFLAANVGATAQLDAVLIALFLPATLATALTSGITRAIVPAYLEASETDGHDAARRLSGAIVLWVGLAGLLLSIALAVFASAFVTITGPGLTDAGRATAAGYLQVLAPVAVMTTLSSVLAAISQAEGRFAAISIAGLAGTATVLATMLSQWGTLGLDGLVIGTLLGATVTMVIFIGSAVRGHYLPVPTTRRDPRLGGLLRHAAPLTVGTAVLQINVIGDRAIASLIGPGAVSFLRYADVLVRVPIGAIGPAWGGAIYPTLVKSTLGRTVGTLAATSARAMHYVLAIFVPIAMLTMAVAPLAVSIAYGRGAFTPEDIVTTAQAVACFAPLLVVVMLGPILTGAHNARRRGTLLLAGGLLNVAVNISLDVVLGRWLGVAGIALASSIAETTVLLFFIVRLTRGGDAFPLQPLARTTVLATIAGAPVAIVVGALVWSGLYPTEIVLAVATLVAIGLLGALGYLVVALRLGMEEPRIILHGMTDPVSARLGRGRSA